MTLLVDDKPGWAIDPLEALTNITRRIVGEDGPPDADDPDGAYRYCLARRETIRESTRVRRLIRVLDKNLQNPVVVGGEISCSGEELTADSGTASVILPASSHIAQLAEQGRLEDELHLIIDDPVNPSWRTRWGGKIVNTVIKRDENGLKTVELQAVSMREHAKHVLIASNPIFPLEVQQPKAFVMPGNTRTACAITLTANLLRVQNPVLNVITNIADPGAWLQAIMDPLNIDVLRMPLQCAPVNPLTDQSMTTLVCSRWGDFHSATKDLLADSGVVLRAYTYLTTDEEGPFTELGPLADVIRPQRNCVVFAFEDKSGITGPTGTILDGPLRLVAKIADDGIVSDLVNLDLDKDGDPDPIVAKLLGVAPNPPAVVFREHEYSGIESSTRTKRVQTAVRSITGGKSPGWVNQLQTWGIRYGLSWLGYAMYYGWGNGSIEGFGLEGIDNLYQGQLDDSLLAFMGFTDPRRVLLCGDFAFQEVFERGQGTGWTLSALLDLRSSNHKTRAYESHNATIRPWPRVPNTDYFLGDRVGVQYGSIIHADNITRLKFEWDQSKPITWSMGLSVDDDEDAFSRAMRLLQGVYSFVGLLFGNGTLF